MSESIEIYNGAEFRAMINNGAIAYIEYCLGKEVSIGDEGGLVLCEARWTISYDGAILLVLNCSGCSPEDAGVGCRVSLDGVPVGEISEMSTVQDVMDESITLVSLHVRLDKDAMESLADLYVMLDGIGVIERKGE